MSAISPSVTSSAPAAPSGRVLRLRQRHPWLGGFLVSLAFLLLALGTASHIDMPFRDPEGAIGKKMLYPFLLLVAFLGVDIVFRVLRLMRRDPDHSWRGAVRRVASERLRPAPLMTVLLGFVSFHMAYLAYRNLKSYLIVLREGVSYDWTLMEADRWLFGGATPADVLHDLLGTGVASYVLDSAYVGWLAFVPISVAVALMWTSNVRHGYWYVTALSLNWILGTASYYLLPALGPVYIASHYFEDLPTGGVYRLQDYLFEDRLMLVSDPFNPEIQSIAAFASLHVSVVFTAWLILRRLGHQRMADAMMVFLVLTCLATVYFGWHYVWDDVAGLFIGWSAVVIAGWLTASSERAAPGRIRRAMRQFAPAIRRLGPAMRRA